MINHKFCWFSMFFLSPRFKQKAVVTLTRHTCIRFSFSTARLYLVLYRISSDLSWEIIPALFSRNVAFFLSAFFVWIVSFARSSWKFLKKALNTVQRRIQKAKIAETLRMYWSEMFFFPIWNFKRLYVLNLLYGYSRLRLRFQLSIMSSDTHTFML